MIYNDFPRVRFPMGFCSWLFVFEWWLTGHLFESIWDYASLWLSTSQNLAGFINFSSMDIIPPKIFAEFYRLVFRYFSSLASFNESEFVKSLYFSQ